MSQDFPEIAGFSQFFKGRARFSETLTNVIADAYSWSIKLDPTAADNLPLPFVSNNDEVVWSYLKHQNKQLDTFNRKFKGFLDEMVGKNDIKLTEKKVESSDDEEEDFEDEEDIEDEEEEDDDEEDVDLLNLKEEDLKDLEKELNEMEEDDDENDEEGAENVKNGSEGVEEKKKFKKSVVDDQFFCLDEMRNFLEISERGNGRLQEDMMFEDDADWDGKTAYQYEDFFGLRAEVEKDENKDVKKKDKKKDKKKRKLNEVINGQGGEGDESIDDGKQKKRVRFAMDEEEEEEDEVDDEEEAEEVGDQPVLLGADLEEEKEVSAFAKRQKKMKEKISKLEDENLAPRSWELSGEVAAEQREKNTLLEQPVDFDHGAKRAPEVTEEFTDKLEALIKQRIRDKTFDDVVRVTKVEEKGPKFDTTPLEDIHNQKTSLVEVYEKEYQEKTGKDQDKSKESGVNEEHEKIKKKMAELFGLIDALTHFEYRPADSREDVKIVSNMASLRVEEVGAMASSEAQLMAPEEVAKREKGEVKGEEEREKTDKLRERRKKKAKQRDMVAQYGEEKVFGKQKALKLKKKANKEGGNEKVEKVKSSNFFSKLQDTVQQEKRDGKKKKVIKRLKTDKNSVAIKL